MKRSTAWPWTRWVREQSGGDGEVRDGEPSFPSSYDAAGWVKRSCKGGVQGPGRGGSFLNPQSLAKYIPA